MSMNFFLELRTIYVEKCLLANNNLKLITWRWLLIWSLVRPLTRITSLICFGVAAGKEHEIIIIIILRTKKQLNS